MLAWIHILLAVLASFSSPAPFDPPPSPVPAVRHLLEFSTSTFRVSRDLGERYVLPPEKVSAVVEASLGSHLPRASAQDIHRILTYCTEHGVALEEWTMHRIIRVSRSAGLPGKRSL